MKIEERERECFRLLELLPAGKFILIGGYATSSFDFPRFSVDLDIVITEKDQGHFAELLKQAGCRETSKGRLEKEYQGSFQRFVKKINRLPVSIDLMVNMVHSRQTDTSYSYDYLRRHSELRQVFGQTAGLSVEAFVPKAEMLMALKINSMRAADQRDIVALCNQDIDTTQVVHHLKGCPREVILANLNKLGDFLDSSGHKDSIKGVFGISDKVYDRLMKRAKGMLEGIKGELGA